MDNRKVYSCSMFFNEFDILDLKYHTLDNLVDYFVVSESYRTHSGLLRKPEFYYGRKANRYKEFQKKTINQFLMDTPSDYTALEKKKWDSPAKHLVIDRVKAGNWWPHNVESYGRDTFEKESLIMPLLNSSHPASPGDIILLSDMDEIVRPEALKEVLDNFDPNQIYHFQHDVFYYYMNLQKDEPWHGTIALTFAKFLENSFCEMRTYKKGIFVPNGGWHFTFQNGVKAIHTKLESYGEQSLNLPFIKDKIQQSVENAIEIGADLFGRPCTFTIRDINDGTFPTYLVEHQHDIFKNYIKR